MATDACVTAGGWHASGTCERQANLVLAPRVPACTTPSATQMGWRSRRRSMVPAPSASAPSDAPVAHQGVQAVVTGHHDAVWRHSRAAGSTESRSTGSEQKLRKCRCQTSEVQVRLAAAVTRFATSARPKIRTPCPWDSLIQATPWFLLHFAETSLYS